MTSAHRYVGVQILAKVLAAASLVLMVREAGANATGGFIFGTAVAGATMLFLDWGRSKTLTRVVAAGGSAEAVRAVIAGASGRSRLIGALSILGLPFAHGKVLMVLIAVIAGTVLCMNGLSESILLGHGVGGIAATGNLVSNIVAIAALVISITLGYSTSAALVLTYLVGAIGASAFFSLCQARSGVTVMAVNPWRIKRPSARDSQLYASERVDARQSGLLMLSTFFYFRADILLLAALVSPSLLAAYGTSYRFVEVCVGLLQLLAAARQPTVARALLSQSASADDEIGDTYAVVFLTSAVMALTVIAVGPALYAWLFGPEVAGGSGLVALLALVVPGHGIVIAGNALLFGAAKCSGDGVFVRSVALMSVAAMCTAILVGHALAELRGVAYGGAAAEAIVGVGVGVAVLRRLGRPLPRVLLVAPPFLILAAPLAVSPSALWRGAGCVCLAAMAVGCCGRRARAAALVW